MNLHCLCRMFQGLQDEAIAEKVIPIRDKERDDSFLNPQASKECKEGDTKGEENKS